MDLERDMVAAVSNVYADNIAFEVTAVNLVTWIRYSEGLLAYLVKWSEATTTPLGASLTVWIASDIMAN